MITSNAGAYTLSPTIGTLAANNYLFSVFNNGTLTVTPAPLTVTADDKTKWQSTANPALTVSYTGFVNGDTSNSLTERPSATVTAATRSPAGTYPISPSGGLSLNYNFTYVAGTLTVLASAPPVFTTEPVSQTIRLGNPVTFTAAASGTPEPTYQWWKNGQNIAGATSNTYTIAHVALADAGRYTVVATNPAGSVISGAALLTVGSAATDFDRDGHPDILWRNIVDGTVGLWLMNPDLTVKAYLDIGMASLSWQIAGSGDFDGDGQTDILWRNTTSGLVSLWLMNPDLSVKAYVDIGIVSKDWQIAGTGDFDGDGHMDVLWRNTASGLESLWLMNPDLSVKAYVDIGIVSKDWQIVGTGDFDADNHVDILWQNTTNGIIGLWLMNPDLTVKAYLNIGVVSGAWQIAGAGDFDGDGYTDILWRNSANGLESLWLMNPDFSVKAYVDIGVVSQDWQIAR
jgi:hypothetical protein